eukprot:2828154-Ditylum_brightwellii.AAC.1
MAYFITHPGNGISYFRAHPSAEFLFHSHSALKYAHHMDCTRMRWPNLVKRVRALRWSNFIALLCAVVVNFLAHPSTDK